MNNDKPKIPWWEPGMVLFAKLSVWIGGPIVVAVFVGKWLDGKYGTTPWIFLATVAFAFILSSVGIIREAKGMMDDIIEKGEHKKNTEGKRDNTEEEINTK